MKQVEWVRDARDRLSGQPAISPVLVGFDGFVDEILHLVQEREGPETYRRLRGMEGFAERIEAAAGLSCNIEMVPQMVKLGGNAPILANALAILDHPTHYIGAIGKDTVHPVFQDFANRCESVHSLADPAVTHAIEFDDGKILLGKMESLGRLTWRELTRSVTEDDLTNLLAACGLVACVNWTMLPYMNDLLNGVEHLLGRLDERRVLFIDLADPAKRTREDVAEVLQLLGEIQDVADVILGMNKNESGQVSDVLGIASTHDLQFRAEEIRRVLGIHLVVIHPADSAYAASADDSWHVHGPYTPEPKLTTGAGDVFNSGFCHGILAGGSPLDALLTGVAASGFYVRNCRSANRKELSAFMKSWMDVHCGTLP